jgi:protein-disulfide isomerase
MRNSKTIPIAIMVAGVIVGSAFFLAKGSGDERVTTDSPNIPNPGEELFVPVGPQDHILGNPNARLKIVEYSDTECPYCKEFHGVMQRIMDEFGTTGEVAWVYRHFPLEQIHSRAPKEAEATECAAELGGNAGFWNFINRVFEITPSNNGLSPELLPEIAESIGIDRKEFEKCQRSGRHEARIAESYQEAFSAGARGTPHIIVSADDNLITLSGAQTYASMRSIITTVLTTPSDNSIDF